MSYSYLEYVGKGKSSFHPTSLRLHLWTPFWYDIEVRIDPRFSCDLYHCFTMTLESFLTYLLIVIWAHNCTEKVSKGFFFFFKRIHIFLNLTCFASIRQIKLLRQLACICCRSDWIRAFHWITSQLHPFLCCFHLYSTWLRGFLRSVYYMYFVFQSIK